MDDYFERKVEEKTSQRRRKPHDEKYYKVRFDQNKRSYLEQVQERINESNERIKKQIKERANVQVEAADRYKL